jgi:hypothetical protein
MIRTCDVELPHVEAHDDGVGDAHQGQRVVVEDAVEVYVCMCIYVSE